MISTNGFNLVHLYFPAHGEIIEFYAYGSSRCLRKAAAFALDEDCGDCMVTVVPVGNSRKLFPISISQFSAWGAHNGN